MSSAAKATEPDSTTSPPIAAAMREALLVMFDLRGKDWCRVRHRYHRGDSLNRYIRFAAAAGGSARHESFGGGSAAAYDRWHLFTQPTIAEVHRGGVQH